MNEFDQDSEKRDEAYYDGLMKGLDDPYSVYYTAEGGKISGHMLSVFATQIPYVNFNLKF